MIKIVERIIKKIINKIDKVYQKYKDNKERIKMFLLLFNGINSFLLFFLGDKLNGMVLHLFLIITGGASFVEGIMDYKLMYTEPTMIREILGLITIGFMMLIIGLSYFL